MNEYSNPVFYFDLTAFENVVQRRHEILGALYFGSLGRGTADRYSDLDIMIWIDDTQRSEVAVLSNSLLGKLGDVQFSITRDPMSVRAFTGPAWRRIELIILQTSELVPAAKYHEARIIKDTNKRLATFVAESLPEVVESNWYQVRCSIEEAIDSQIFLALHNARGASWSAMGEISFRLSELHTLLSRLRGYRSFGFRYVETRLSAHEQMLIDAAWPRRPERSEVRRSARALWNFTHHVWTEAEAVLGKSLEIDLVEPRFLDVIDEIYEAPQ